MNDRELLEAILAELKDTKENVQNLQENVQNLQENVKDVKRQMMKSTAELKAMDNMIFDEVERVHEILNRHTDNKAIHRTA